MTGAADHTVRLRTLVDRVAREVAVDRSDLVGPARTARLARARFAVVWLARTALVASWSEIGRQLGGRSHATAIHGFARAEALRGTDPAFRDLTDRLLAGEPVAWRRSDDSFTDRYGDGYERVTPAGPVVPPAATNEAPTERAEPPADNVVPLRVALAEALAPALAPRDVVDEAVDAAMADEGWTRAFAGIVDPLVAQLQAARSPEEVAAILAREAELADTSSLVEHLARAGFALRMDALTDAAGEG